MVQEIEQCQGLQSLRLEGNTLGVEAAQAISKALEAKSELEVIFKWPLDNFTLICCLMYLMFFFLLFFKAMSLE